MQVNKALNSVQMQLTRYTKCTSHIVQAIVDGAHPLEAPTPGAPLSSVSEF